MFTFEQRSAERSSQESSRGDVSATTSTYRSSMGPRVTNVQRSRQMGIGGGGGGVMTRAYQSFQSSGGIGAFGAGLAALANFPGVPLRGGSNTTMALVGFNVTRQRDKRELVQLNDKFAQYIEKVRFLEAQNRKLTLELEVLRSRSGHGSSRIKEMYDIEMDEARKMIEGIKRETLAVNGKISTAEAEVKRQRARYVEVTNLREIDRKEVDALERQIAENFAQINLFRRRLADIDEEVRRYKSESQRVSSEIGRLQAEIQNERFLKSSCDVEKVALEDEIATAKQLHEVDMANIRAQSVSNDLDPSLFFRNELALAIQEIRSAFEADVERQRNEMHGRFSLTYNELIIQQQRPEVNFKNVQQQQQEERFRSELLSVQNQSGYLRAQNQDVRNRIDELKRRMTLLREEGSFAQSRMLKEIQEAKRRLEQVTIDYEEVSSLKTTLEKEISTYRELLESQNGLRGYVDRIVQNAEMLTLERSTAQTSGYATGAGGFSSSVSSSGGLGTGGSSTTITRTVVSSNDGNYSYGGSSGRGLVSSLVSQSSRPSTSVESLSSAVRTTFRAASSSSSSPTRRAGDN